MRLMRSHRLSAVVDEPSILVERKVRAYAIVICLIIGEQMANMPLPQRHDMVKALASDRSDQPFNMTVLPRRTWRDRPISMPMARSRRVTATPEEVSRSRMR